MAHIRNYVIGMMGSYKLQSKAKMITEKQQSVLSTRSDLDEVTTAIINAAKGRIHAAKRSQELAKMATAAAKGVEGDYYIDRYTFIYILMIYMQMCCRRSSLGSNL